jgi:hypothetical protein
MNSQCLFFNNKVGGFYMSYCLIPSQISFTFTKSYAILLNKTEKGVIHYSSFNIQIGLNKKAITCCNYYIFSD